jgi:uncharacterized Zn-finger protein
MFNKILESNVDPFEEDPEISEYIDEEIISNDDESCEEDFVEEETLNENVNLISYQEINDVQEEAFIEETLESPIECVETSDNRFLCSYCSNTFKSKDTLRRHMVRHTEKSKFKCTLCPRKFFFERDLKFHLKQHANPKIYTCEDCGKSYGSNTALKTHILTHSDTREFLCTFNDSCLKRFRTKFSLQNHIKTHTKDKDFFCFAPNCNLKFTQKNILQRHLKAKHQLNLYSCTYCNEKTFEKHRELRDHFIECDAFNRSTQE